MNAGAGVGASDRRQGLSWREPIPAPFDPPLVGVNARRAWCQGRSLDNGLRFRRHETNRRAFVLSGDQLRSAQWRRLWLIHGGSASFFVLVMAAVSCWAGWTIPALTLGVAGLVAVLAWVWAS